MSDITESQTSSDIILLQPHQQQQQLPGHRQQATKIQQQQQHKQRQEEHELKRHTARSISECVDIDYADEDVPLPSPQSIVVIKKNVEDADDDNVHEEEEEDDDDGDFTTLSAMNESPHTHTASLLGNIDFTAKTSSSVINETISGHVGGEDSTSTKMTTNDDDEDIGRDGGSGGGGGDTPKFLVNFSSDDEKSTQLCNTDNESVNSIDFKADISRGGLVVQGIPSNTGLDGDESTHEEAGAATTVKSSNDAFTTFFSNFNAGK